MTRRRWIKQNTIVSIGLILIMILTPALIFWQGGEEPDNPMQSTAANISKRYETSQPNGQEEESREQESTKKSEKNENKNEKMNGSLNQTDNSNSHEEGENHKTVIKTDSKSKKKTSSKPTDILYFKTTIIDGQTVAKYEYAFSITHMIPELEIEGENVYVNGEHETHFQGSVILKEGRNQIKVSVTYRDEDGQEIVAQKTYTVYVDTKNLIITTDLKNQTTDTPFLNFTAYATMGNQQADIFVTCNKKNVTGEKNMYEVTLQEGKNEIIIKAEYAECVVSNTYEIVWNAKSDFGIDTDLKEQTVNVERIQFRAVLRNGTGKAKLSVIVNGNPIKASNEKYTANLKIGNNTIRIKGTDSGGVSVQNTYTIVYVPVATQQTEPKLTYINIYEGMDVQGQTFTLNIGAQDYLGDRIYYDGIEVVLNGRKIQYRWSSDYTSYLLQLLSGSNQVDVRITDRDGRWKEYSYTINGTVIDEGTLIGTATVSIDAKVLHLGILMKPKKVDIYYGDNGAKIIERAMEGSGYTYTYAGTIAQGFYLETLARPGMLRGWMIDEQLKQEIIDDGLQFNIDSDSGEYIYDMDSLGQLDFCQGSGWSYSVNGTFKEYGLSEYMPAANDNIQIRYTLSYGKDIGGYNTSSGVHGIKETYSITY